jgi:hypothetical protein
MRGNLLRLAGIRKSTEWTDKDHVMLHACFQLLVDFIEQEKPQTIVDYRHDRRQRKEWKELRSLYRYWKVERPRMQREVDRALGRWSAKYRYRFEPSPDGQSSRMVVLSQDKAAGRRHWQLERRFDEREDEMLRRLIAIRRHLWC